MSSIPFPSGAPTAVHRRGTDLQSVPASQMMRARVRSAAPARSWLPAPTRPNWSALCSLAHQILPQPRFFKDLFKKQTNCFPQTSEEINFNPKISSANCTLEHPSTWSTRTECPTECSSMKKFFKLNKFLRKKKFLI